MNAAKHVYQDFTQKVTKSGHTNSNLTLIASDSKMGHGEFPISSSACICPLLDIGLSQCTPLSLERSSSSLCRLPFAGLSLRFPSRGPHSRTRLTSTRLCVLRKSKTTARVQTIAFRNRCE